LEAEVDWAIKQLPNRKAPGIDGIPIELIRSVPISVLISLCQQIGELASGQTIGQTQYLFQFQRKTTQKNAPTIELLL